MAWIQKTLELKPQRRGFHLITKEIEAQVREIKAIKVGLAHLFIQHTSASLAINENADPDVRVDLERHFNAVVPADAPYYKHITEGSDDMPAHIKSVMIGSSISLPITNGHFNLGTWQGIYLCEHRDQGGARRIVVTLCGD